MPVQSCQHSLVDSELGAILGGARKRRLIGFEQNEVFQYQYVHVGEHETAIGLFGSVDNRLSTDIEAGVDDNATAGAGFEGFDDVVEEAVALFGDCLQSSTEVDVRYGRDRGLHQPEPVDSGERLIFI